METSVLSVIYAEHDKLKENVPVIISREGYVMIYAIPSSFPFQYHTLNQDDLELDNYCDRKLIDQRDGRVLRYSGAGDMSCVGTSDPCNSRIHISQQPRLSEAAPILTPRMKIVLKAFTPSIKTY